MKFKALAIVAAGLVVAGSAFAGDKSCCAQHAKNDKTACAMSLASLDLSADQKTKMESLAAECDKAGCTKESMAKMESAAKGILSKDQFAAWNSACKTKAADEKKQS